MLRKFSNWILRKILYCFDLCSTICHILLKESSLSKGQLLWIYLKLKCKEIVFFWLLRRPMTEECILGFHVRFQDYGLFLFLFEEIFVDEDYGFHSQQPNPLIVDCGSNVGMSILYFKKRYPQARIIAFEALKPIYDTLEKNMTVNHLEEVTLYNKAVSDKAGALKFYYDQKQLGSAVEGFKGESGQPVQEMVVEAVRLSDYIKEGVDFLKMDIEGAEMAVLEDLAQHGKLGLIKEMILEYHHHINPEVDNMSSLLSLLEKNGFGYQIRAGKNFLMKRKISQDLLVYAYQKERIG